jgi:cell division protein FtsQ
MEAQVSARVRFTPRFPLAVAGLVAVGGLLFGAWLWVRDSSLVAVDQVTIGGVAGADAPAIRSALRSAARNMTTLDVKMNQLQTAVAPFPEVKRLHVRTVFPHRIVIDVVEQRPVAVVQVGGREVPVAADGTLLRSVAVTATLPTIPLSVPPVGSRLAEGGAADAVAVLAAAPYQLLARISQTTTVAGRGLVAQLRGGPSVYFGDTTRLAAKWLAVTEVLADPGSAGAAYIDVTDPARPAAGAGTIPGTTPGTTSAGTTTATTSGTTSAGTTAGTTAAASASTPAAPGSASATGAASASTGG